MAMPASSAPPPFVGRQQELAVLLQWLEAAQRGEGGVLLVSGEPGAGKTRLLQELMEHARHRRNLVLTGQAFEAGGMAPYAPLVEALRPYVSACPEEELRAHLGGSAAELAVLLPELQERLQDLPLPSPAPAEHERFRLFEGVSEFLLNMARSASRADAQGCLVLALDDLHWADVSTLLFLRHLKRKLARLSRAPLLLLGGYRESEVEARRPGGRRPC
jgi:predicted ATPase